MNKSFNRRTFLKLAALSSLSGLLSPLVQTLQPKLKTDQKNQNILIILLDTLSARHISLHGYLRETMPNLAKFAEKSTIFHQHHSSGNFTSPSTASLLTGTYPWTHRAFNIDGTMIPDFSSNNIFSIFQNSYTTIGYTHNLLVEILLSQCQDWMSIHPNMNESSLFFERAFTNKKDVVSSYWGERISRGEFSGLKPALFFGSFIDMVQEGLKNQKLSSFSAENLHSNILTTHNGLTYELRDTLDWLVMTIEDLPSPFFNYIHLYPPHDPYLPSDEFFGLFDDNWTPPHKPEHIFTENQTYEALTEFRLRYDQFTAYTDKELGILIQRLEDSAKMRDSYIIITSDHGELFERGIWGHLNRVLYEPLTHIPLIIHKPGQKDREDIYAPTSIVDILPTLCQITGQTIPEWTEGEVLPGFRDTPIDPQRPIFSVEAKENSKFGPLTIATVAMIQWPYKLIHYFGYEELPYHFELYNLEDDPEELVDLYSKSPEAAQPMTEILLAKLDEVNQPYLRKQ